MRFHIDIINVVLVVLGGLPLIVSLAGVSNAFFFARARSARLGISRRRAFGAYMLTVLVANIAYVVFALVYYAVAIGIA